ncbi:hypothetical protein [Flavobacterium sp. NKUCC04_CG]|uniref:hypothetical protein n=1 Tax=Flavobacterium sp. NKUCC04_CG TaxID=2842121 RepID=UPI001C5AC8FF|nr:hypothetical protein [Flavobacterium sp. NKUCC04_CG]MBW3519965.1 hypothetical protein [Flavobacterium sp. NKUCC04_CG]
MKFYYLLPLAAISITSCHADFEERDSLNVLTSKSSMEVPVPKTTYIHLIAPQLVKSYKEYIDLNPVTTLSQKLAALDMVSNQNSSFTAIKPMNYQLISDFKANQLTGNVDQLYIDLNVSNSVKYYLDNLLLPTTNLSAMLTSIDLDKNLTADEIKLLSTIVAVFQTELIGNDDDSWRRTMIVGLVMGLKESNAQATFNISWIKIHM